MTLTWTHHDQVVGTLTAVGARGVYNVQQVGPQWILQGVGHDQLSMLALPVCGKPFSRLDAAQRWAERLNHVTTVEAQASGT